VNSDFGCIQGNFLSVIRSHFSLLTNIFCTMMYRFISALELILYLVIIFLILNDIQTLLTQTSLKTAYFFRSDVCRIFKKSVCFTVLCSGYNYLLLGIAFLTRQKKVMGRN
jgi:hypothetical protein